MSDYLTIEEIADDLQIPRRTIYYFMQKGDFPKTRSFGRHKRVHIDDYLSWQASRVQASNGDGQMAVEE
jgi:excisionase family DNA binding protein